MGDWLADLEVFPASVVALAVTDWRRNNSRRPTPADIRGLCVLTTAPKRAPPQLTGPHQDAPEQRINFDIEQRHRQWAEAEASREAWAKECGYANFAEGMAAGITKNVRYPWQRNKRASARNAD